MSPDGARLLPEIRTKTEQLEMNKTSLKKHRHPDEAPDEHPIKCKIIRPANLATSARICGPKSG